MCAPKGTETQHDIHKVSPKKKNKITIRKFSRGDGEALTTLCQEVFERKIRNDYWKWKFYDNPAGKHFAFVALDGEKIIGAIACIPMKATFGGKVILASQATDLMIAQDYRRATPFFRLSQFVQRDVWDKNTDFIYGIAKKEHCDIYTKLLGYHRFGPLHMMIKILNPSPFLNKRLKNKILSCSIGALSACSLKLSNLYKSRSHRGIEIRDVDQFSPDNDELCREHDREHKITIARDSEYLNWRYFRNPIQKYRAFASFNEGKRTGFIILCLKEKDGIRRGYIVDLVTSPSAEDSTDRLIAKAVSYFYDEKADSINAWMLSNTLPYQIMTRSGFVPRPTHHYMLVKAKPPGLDDEFISNRSNWYLTLGDSDHY